MRLDDEIVVAGQRFHTGTRVVTWMDPGGYDAYRGAKKLGVRQAVLNAEEKTRMQNGGWDYPLLQKHVDQFVLHYDGHGLSQRCFDVLRQRGLSVHFLLDCDGTVYQTLDLKERALHATTSNDRSIGIEIANLGAFPPDESHKLDGGYTRDAEGHVCLRLPDPHGEPRFPARPDLVRGSVQDTELVQYDFTPEQYAALIKLSAALCRLFPMIKCDYPHDAAGQLITRKLPDDALADYQGILGHFHIQTNKTDPGPALQWDKVIAGARLLAK